MSDDKSACAKCGQAWGEHVGDGHDEPICPDPAPDKSAGLTRACGEKLTLACDLPRGHAGPHWEDERPALRAEIERLHTGDEQRVRDLTRHIERADKAEAEVERLRKALREIEWEVEFCSVDDGCNGCLIHRIAAAAIKEAGE